jgi:endonuclease G
MSNMSPQLPNLNRGVWKHLEASTRAWAWGRKHNLTVYSGNIYTTGKSKTIGENKVVVPDQLYKIVIDNNTSEVMAFVFPNIDKQEIDLKARLTSVAAIEAASGVVFPLPKGADKSAVAKDVWPADIGDAMSAKKTTCKVKIKK